MSGTGSQLRRDTLSHSGGLESFSSCLPNRSWHTWSGNVELLSGIELLRVVIRPGLADHVLARHSLDGETFQLHRTRY